MTQCAANEDLGYYRLACYKLSSRSSNNERYRSGRRDEGRFIAPQVILQVPVMLMETHNRFTFLSGIRS